MSDFSRRLENLSPQQRELLLKKIKGRKSKLSSIPRRRNLTEFPMSSAQQRLWFLNQLESDNPFYNIPGAFLLKGALNIKALRESINSIVQRHEVLRSCYSSKSNSPVQKILDFQLQIPVEELSFDSQNPDFFNQLALQEASKPFNLSSGPLVRAKLFRLNDMEHLLLLTFHHIVFDGWSLGVFLKEFSQLYPLFSQEQKHNLPPLPIQYADYADWQQKELKDQRLLREKEFWLNRLGNLDELLHLPLDFPRPKEMQHQGQHFKFKLDETKARSIDALIKKINVTPFMFFLAAFRVFLYRYSYQNNFGIGTPVANRNRVEIEQLIGFFVNTLVMHTPVHGQQSFTDLMSKTRKNVLDSMANQEIPFEILVDELATHRSLSHTPLFQVMYSYHDLPPIDEVELPGLKIIMLENESGTAKFDLMLIVERRKNNYSLVFEYNTSLFREDTISRFSREFINLITGILENPDRRLIDLPLLETDLRHQLTNSWNKRVQPTLTTDTITTRFESVASQIPEETAVIFEDNQLTFKELNEKANQLARFLVRQEVGPEQPVGLALPRSTDLIVAIMAVLKAGAAYLPLDPNYPKQRLRFIIDDSRCSLIITNSAVRHQLPDCEALTVNLNVVQDQLAAFSKQNLVRPADARQLAYIIYTSGSTGQPKGVMVQHNSVLNLLRGLEERMYSKLNPDRMRASLNAPVLFDASVKQIVLLLKGYTLCLIPDECRNDPGLMIEYIQTHRIDILDCVPSQLRLLVDSGLLDADKSYPKIAVPGGEAIDHKFWQVLAGQQKILFFNMYGPTEGTVVSSLCPVQKHPDHPAIGRPLENVQIYILDKYFRLVPPGVTGQICIGGANLTRGYLNRPEETAQKFIPNPFAGSPGQRLYLSGDLGYYDRDGQICFAGRADTQVKVRGFRIELGEIEQVILRHPHVHEATVTTFPHPYMGDTRIIAHVSCKKESKPGVSGIESFLKKYLPDFMIPDKIMIIDAFPYTPNRKIDRNRLPSPFDEAKGGETSYIPPANSLERKVAAAWSDILGIKNPGRSTDFFASGGNSLQAAVFTNHLQKELAVNIPVALLFRESRLGDFCRQLQKLLPDTLLQSFDLERDEEMEPTSSTIFGELRPVPREEFMPLSFSQERLWFLDQLMPGSAQYNIPIALDVNGPLDVFLLRKTFEIISGRHEILRTTLHEIDGQGRQKILNTPNFSFGYKDLRADKKSEQDLIVNRVLKDESRQPFNLSTGPLLRVTLLQRAENRFFLILVIHHVIFDGWSMNIFLDEFTYIYSQLSRGQSPALPELPIQYADFASAQRAALNEENLTRQLAFWKNELMGCPTLLEMPTDFPRPAMYSFEGAKLSIEIPEKLSAAINNYTKKKGITPFLFFMAAFQALLARYTRQSDICVGTPIAYRNRPEIEKLIGFFVNVLVIRTQINSNACFEDIYKSVQSVFKKAMEHQDIPFEKLVDEIQPERDMSHTPLYQAMFAMQSTLSEEIKLPGIELKPVSADTGTSKTDLTLSLAERGPKYAGQLEYNAALFKSETMAHFIDHFLNLISNVLEYPAQPLARLSILTREEEDQIIYKFNEGNKLAHDDTVSLHERFEQQVEKTKNLPAVFYKDQVLTYHELNCRANQLARYLVEKGVCPEKFVGICLDRSFDMIIAILAILKAGAAYVPMDPHYPTDRLAWMVEDTGLELIISKRAYADVVQIFPARPVYLDAQQSSIEKYDTGNLLLAVDSHNLCYVIYTSGSTGRPKGVLLQHNTVVGLAEDYIHMFKMGPDRRVLQFFSYSFDGSVGDFFMALLSGATLVLVPEEQMTPEGGLSQLIRSQKITHAIVPPAILSVLPADNYPDWEYLASGGDVCPPELAFKWRDHLNFFNAYGPTETSVCATWYSARLLDKSATNVPIGVPIPNYKIYILDDQLNPVPAGVPGQMFIAGQGVARGYLNRPELTAEKFIPDPYSGQEGLRMYASGDLCRYLSDGNIEFLGRIDQQVKIRGFRIEPGEIEAALLRNENIAEALVLARDFGREKQLVAYLIAAASVRPDVGELRNFLRQFIPDYMIPAYFVFLDKMPVAATGKIDRHQLPIPEISRESLGSTFVAPSTQQEKILASIWQNLLNLKQVGVNDNFFELGGDSILSIQVVARARRQGVIITPRQIFENPTIAGLARQASSGPKIQADQDELSGLFQLTPIQRWFFSLDLSEPWHWNQANLVMLNAPLEEGFLRDSLQHILRHHDILRACFVRDNGGWKGRIAPFNDQLPLRIEHLQGDDEDRLSRDLVKKVAGHQASFELDKGPLFKVVYFRLPQDHKDRILFIAHHLVIDGVSWRIILEDLLTLYNQYQSEQEYVLPLKSTSFSYWSAKLYEYAQSAAIQEELDYWQKIDTSRISRIETDFSKGPNDEQSSALISGRLSPQETSELQQPANLAYGTSVQELLIAALYRTCSLRTGQQNMYLLLEHHGRETLFDDVDISRTVGWFTAAYPILISIGNGLDEASCIKSVKEKVRSIPGNGIGFGLLKYLTDKAQTEDLRKLPEPDISFNYLGQFGNASVITEQLGRIEPSPGFERSPGSLRMQKLAISCSIHQGQLFISFQYSRNLFRKETIEGWLSDFLEAIRTILNHCREVPESQYTPSDFRDVKLSDDDIQDLISEIEE